MAIAIPEGFFDSDIGELQTDVAAADRKFQTSIVVKQDPNKSGILSFLTTVEKQTQSQPQTEGTEQTNSGGGAY